jgi:hypothetical protein
LERVVEENSTAVLLKDLEILVMYKYGLCSVKAKVKQSRYSPGGAQRVPGSSSSHIS